MMWHRWLFVLMLCSVAGYGQQKSSAYLYLGMQDGLASNNVRTIIQDHNRYIWIGTENGLQRYDGRKFVSYRKRFFDDNSILSDNVEKILEDKDGLIWIVTPEGVCTLDPRQQKFRQVAMDIPAEEHIVAKNFFQDSKGNIWLSTSRSGTFIYDRASKRFRDVLKGMKGLRWGVRAISEDIKTGLYWLGCDSGLAVYDMQAGEVYSYGHNPRQIPELNVKEFYGDAVNAFLRDDANMWVFIWTHKKKGYACYRYNRASGTLSKYIPSDMYGHEFWKDSKGTVWLTGEVYNYYDTVAEIFRNVERSKAKNGIDYTYVCQPIEDAEHNTWIGTDKGIYISNAYNQKITTVYFGLPEAKQFKDCQVQGFLELKNGDIWVATWSAGLYAYDSKLRLKNHWPFANVPGDYSLLWCMHETRDGKVWIGCQAGRLMIYDPARNSFEYLKPEACGNSTIRSVTEDGNGNIWLGTQRGDIVKRDKASGKFVKCNERSYGAVTRLIADKQGDLWAATFTAGLVKIDTGTGKATAQYVPERNNRNAISSNSVLCGIDNDTTLILGTGMGVNIFNKRTREFRHITTGDGLPGNTIYSAAKDKRGNVWLKLYDGLAKVSLRNNEVTLYGDKEGIMSNGDINTVSEIIGERVLVGCHTGFIYFHADSMIKDDVPPDVQISVVRVFDKEFNIDSIFQANKPLRLKHNQNFISIQFSSPSFFNHNLTYYYQLEGIDHDWIKADASLTTNYSNLPGGDYQFKVKCVNGEGVASKHVTILPISIRPPVWQTWWFIALTALGVGGIVYSIHYFRVERLLAMEKVRERIALDLHDDMGSTLSTINILSEMAKMKVKSDTVKTEEYIGKISDNSVRMMEAMDDIVWSINPKNDSMQKILARMREYAANILEAKDIDYQFVAGEHINYVKLNMATRKDLFLIYKEALNNLAKYSGCRKAHIEIEIVNNKLLMTIKDDGVGFDVNNADNGNGLENMRKRAESAGGKLEIASKLNAGTKLQLELKLA